VVKIEQTIFVLPLVECRLFYGIINRLHNNRNCFFIIKKSIFLNLQLIYKKNKEEKIL
jgi:hypothetical protein